MATSMGMLCAVKTSAYSLTSQPSRASAMRAVTAAMKRGSAYQPSMTGTSVAPAASSALRYASVVRREAYGDMGMAPRCSRRARRCSRRRSARRRACRGVRARRRRAAARCSPERGGLPPGDLRQRRAAADQLVALARPRAPSRRRPCGRHERLEKGGHLRRGSRARRTQQGYVDGRHLRITFLSRARRGSPAPASVAGLRQVPAVHEVDQPLDGVGRDRPGSARVRG